MRITPPSDRCLLAFSMRKEGATLREVGETLGVSTSRVHHMIRTVEDRMPQTHLDYDDIFNLDIPIQAYNALMHYHIDTIDKLRKLSYQDLMSFRNIGIKYAGLIFQAYMKYISKQQEVA